MRQYLQYRYLPPTFNGIGLRNLVTHRDIDSPTPLGHFCTTLRFGVSGKGVLGQVTMGKDRQAQKIEVKILYIPGCSSSSPRKKSKPTAGHSKK